MAANTHLEHLEDDILNNGTAGGKNAIAFLRELGQMLTEPNSTIRITTKWDGCLLYTSPSPRDLSTSRMPSSA